MPEFSLAAAGDAILTRSLRARNDPALETLVDRIRTADAGVVNLEVLLHDYEGPPAADSGGTYMRAPPSVAADLAWAGFDLFATATNHAGDYSTRGMLDTLDALETRDLPSAGLGRTLGEALAPAYAETGAGRVALVAACSSITPGTVAGRQRPDLRGRPGIAPLRLETRFRVPESDLDAIRELADRVGVEAERERRREQGFRVPGADEEGFAFYNPGGGDLQFVAGDEAGVQRVPRKDDVDAYLDAVREANRQADWVVASLHAHEGEGALANEGSVPAWLEAFARDCVDAGADAFVGHGPHVLRGIEVYDGSPVFYSLGNFAMQNETVSRLPADIYERYDLDPVESSPSDLYDERAFDEDGDRIGFLADEAFWQTVVPICRFDKGELDRVECHPVSLAFDADRPERGWPRAADDEEGARILSRVADRSEPYGTDLRIEDGLGVVER